MPAIRIFSPDELHPIIQRSIIVHAPTQEIINLVGKISDVIGWVWNSGNIPDQYIYEDKLAIRLQPEDVGKYLLYNPKEWYEDRGGKVLSFSEFVNKVGVEYNININEVI